MLRIERVRMATEQDDAALRRCLREIPMEGRIRLGAEREPSFFRALAHHEEVQVVVAEAGGELVGFALRAAGTHWLEGRPRRVGYLGNLRLRADARDVRGFSRGWSLLKAAHDEDPVEVYFTTIQESNHQARRVLESGRFGIPRYHHVGTIVSHVFSPRAPRARTPAGLELLRGDEVEPASLQAFVDEQSPTRNLFPHLDLARGRSGSASAPLPPLSAFSVARRAGRIEGLLARWDQRGVKQFRVLGYPPAMRRLRHAINLAARALRRPLLPPEGSILPIVYASLPLVRGDDPALFRALLAHAGARMGAEEHMVIGLAEDDPLLAALSFPAHRERFRLYLVSPEERLPTLTRPAYVEAAML